MTATQRNVAKISFHNKVYDQVSDLFVASGETGISLFLDETGGGSGKGGDCEVGMSRDKARSFSRILEDAIARSAEKIRSAVGTVACDWSDQVGGGEFEPVLSVTAGEGLIDLTIHTGPPTETPPYRAIMDPRATKELLVAIVRNL